MLNLLDKPSFVKMAQHVAVLCNSKSPRNDVVSGIKLGTFGREEGSMVPWNWEKLEAELGASPRLINTKFIDQ